MGSRSEGFRCDADTVVGRARSLVAPRWARGHVGGAALVPSDARCGHAGASDGARAVSTGRMLWLTALRTVVAQVVRVVLRSLGVR